MTNNQSKSAIEENCEVSFNTNSHLWRTYIPCLFITFQIRAGNLGLHYTNVSLEPAAFLNVQFDPEAQYQIGKGRYYHMCNVQAFMKENCIGLTNKHGKFVIDMP